MKFYVKTRLSENILETPEGFLLCKAVPLTHTGALRYVHPEHPFGEDAGEVIIKRSPDELFSPVTMASFEGKDFTVEHPEEFVNPENYQELTHGVMFNIKKSEKKIEIEGEEVEVLQGDFLIKSSEAIALVKAGVREVSLGYEAMWELISDKEGRHSNIIGNHCALVDQGRAGKLCAINDHKKENMFMGLKELNEKFKKLFGKTTDEMLKEKEDEQKAKDEAEAKKKEEESKDESEKEQEKEDKKMSSLDERMSKLEDMMGKLLEKLEGKKSEDEDEEEVIVADEDEEEDESEDSYDSEDEGEEDEEKHKAGDTASRAEILAPGLKAEKDIEKKALSVAYKTADGKKIIDTLTGGKDPSKLPSEGLKAVFIAAAEMMKTKRVSDFAAQKIVTIDSFPALKGAGAKTPDEINKPTLHTTLCSFLVRNTTSKCFNSVATDCRNNA